MICLNKLTPRLLLEKMDILRDFFDNAHFHCLHYVVNRNLHFVERFFWAVWVILSMIAMVFVVNLSLQDYYNMKPTLRVNTNYLEFQTPFPAIFLCETRELSWKTEKMLKEVNFTATDGLYNIQAFVRESTFIDPFGGSKSFPQCYLSSKDDYCRFYRKYVENMSYFSKYIRASCEEMLTSCYYNGRKFNCCQHFLPVDTVEGKCYAFNSFNAVVENRFANQTNPNPKDQSKSLLYQYLPFMIRYNYEDSPGNLSVGLSQRMVNVWTMGNTNIPTKIYRKDHITVIFPEFGEEAQSANIFLKVKETFPAPSVYNLDENKRKCKFWFETKDLKIFKFYSDSACEIECLRNAQIQFCGCVFHTLPNQLGIEQTVCNHTGVECAFKHESKINKFLSTQCRCTMNCHFFDVSFIGKYPRAIENENSETDKIRLNFITRAPAIQYIRGVKQELLDFIVSIGGAITLFIGCSFLSLFQIIYYFLLKPLNTWLLVKEKPKTVDGKLFIKRGKVRDVF